MNRSSLTIRQRFDVELAEKSQTASIAFFVVAVLVYFMDLQKELSQKTMALVCGLIVVFAITRLVGAHKFLKEPVYNKRLMFLVKASIFGNALMWGVVFSSLKDVMQVDSADGFTLMLMLSGLCANSVTTLASNLFLAWSFQISLLGPSTWIAWHDYVTLENGRASLAIFLTIFLVYVVRQTIDSRKNMLEKFKHEVSLEKSNEDLRVSNTRVVEETAKSLHASRLAAVGELAGGIAHEINSPLAVILLNIESLEVSYRNHRADFEKSFLLKTEKMKLAIERVSKIIKGLKSFSQQNDSQQKELIDIGDAVKETLDFCSEKMRQNGVKLEFSGVKNAQVMGHIIQISQVLLNLINNSHYEVIQQSGEKWIRIDSRTEEDRIILSVIDSGKGVSSEHQKKLFQPFFSSRALGEGTGLGLSISRGIMRDHGGDLVFRGNHPHTQFDVILPLANG